MKVTRVVYYCTYTKGPEAPARSPAFTSETAARDEARHLLLHGYLVMLEKHHECKEDSANEEAWRIDFTDPYAIEVLDRFDAML
jgi:hypothetical protein